MHYLNNASGVTVMPPLAEKKFTSPQWFTEGGNGVEPSFPGADYFNIHQAEMLNLLAAAGLDPSVDQLDQIVQSINILANNHINLLKDNLAGETGSSLIGGIHLRTAATTYGLGEAYLSGLVKFWEEGKPSISTGYYLHAQSGLFFTGHAGVMPAIPTSEWSVVPTLPNVKNQADVSTSTLNLHQSISGAASLGCLGFGKIQNYLDYNQSINLSNIEIIAHRGFGGWYVQNSMLAFTHAVRGGAKSIELDLSVTADGVVYVFHDSILDGLMEGTGTFTTLQSSYIDSRKFQALNGSIFYTSEHIPRWADVLRWAKRNGIKLYAEVKNIRTEADISLLVQPVLDQNMSLQVAFSSFDTARLQAIRALSPRSHLMRNGNGSSYPTVIQQLVDMGGNATLGWEKQSIFDDPNIVTACASAGIGLAPYTVYTKQESARLIDLGVRRMLCDINLGAI